MYVSFYKLYPRKPLSIYIYPIKGYFKRKNIQNNCIIYWGWVSFAPIIYRELFLFLLMSGIHFFIENNLLKWKYWEIIISSLVKLEVKNFQLYKILKNSCDLKMLWFFEDEFVLSLFGRPTNCTIFFTKILLKYTFSLHIWL